jgi:uncharacterized protein (TIGR02145 family)
MKLKLLTIILTILSFVAMFIYCCKKDEKDETGNQVTNNPCSSPYKIHPIGFSTFYPNDSAVVLPSDLTLKWSGYGYLPLKFDVLFGTNSDSLKSIGSDLADSFLPLEPLKLNLTYYWNITITDKCGWTRSILLRFSTVPDTTVPYLTTSSVPFVYSTTVPVGGKIYYEGLTPVTERGICYGISSDPEKTGTRFPLGKGYGAFSGILSDLNEATLYYAKSYAVNNNGTFFGPQISFTTGLGNPYKYVIDIEGNKYKCITIGTQTWMAENLKTSKYNDGKIIPLVSDNIKWVSISTPAFCWYSNDSTRFKQLYGGIYNWYAVNNGGLCPAGWHVPSDSEWKTLEMFLGMTLAEADGFYFRGKDQGKQLKFTEGWSNHGNGLNTSGFSALPGGEREQGSGSFSNEGLYGTWWSSTNSTDFSIAYPMTGPYQRNIYSGETGVSRLRSNPSTGKSIRCIKD